MDTHERLRRIVDRKCSALEVFLGVGLGAAAIFLALHGFVLVTGA